MNAIEKLRTNAKITQVQIAKRLGVTQTAVALWESGKSRPRSDKLPELAKALGCSIDDLFGNKDKSA